MSTNDSPTESMNARLWALILILPAVTAFGGQLANIVLYVRWLAPATGATETIWSKDIAPIAMAEVIAILTIALQMIIVAWTYRIDIFPITYSFQKTTLESPRTATACFIAFLAVAAGAAAANLWAAPLLVGGQPYTAAATVGFMVLTIMAAFWLIAPMIVHGERLRTRGDTR